MTIPTTIQLPLQTERILSGNPDEMEKYQRDLVFAIQRMYEDLAQGINGTIRGDPFAGSEQWQPTLNGTSSGTFTYVHQAGWVVRQGLIVDAWFDISWNGTTASGNLYVELPYKVAISNQKPFVGTVQASNVSYTTGTDIVVNAISDTYRGEFWNVGDSIPTANQNVVGSGQLIGHIRYIGKNDE